jgi:plastocyanin
VRRPVLHLAAVAVVGSIALLACGGDDDDTSSAPDTGATAPSVQVVAHDIGFDADSYDATAGTVTLRYVNDGSTAHTLVIEDVDDFKLEVSSKGDEDDGTVDLPAGTYTIYCDVPGHRQAGMEATLEVR